MDEYYLEENKKNSFMGIDFEQQLDVQTRTIYFLDEINEETYRRFCFFFNRLDSSKGDINIHLTSVGGDVGLALAMYDLVTHAKNLVIIKCYGYVYSAATILLQASPVRLVAEECRFLIHDVSGAVGYQKHHDLVLDAKEIQYLANRLINIYQKHSNLSKKQIVRFLKSQTYLGAKEALRYRLVDGFIEHFIDQEEVVNKSNRK